MPKNIQLTENQMEKFHERLSYLMDEVFEISGNTLATAIDWSGGAIYKYKSGVSVPTLTFVVKLCNHLGVSANWLLLNIGPMKLADLPAGNNSGVPMQDIYKQRLMEHDIDILISYVNDFKEKYGKK